MTLSPLLRSALIAAAVYVVLSKTGVPGLVDKR